MIVAKNSSNGVFITFPDVCKVPAPASPPGVPIPYPNIAKTAIAKQQKKTARKATKPTGGTRGISGQEAGARRGIVSSKTMARAGEIQGLKAKLGGLNAKLQNLASGNPAEWQNVLQEYAATASALYLTINDD